MVSTVFIAALSSGHRVAIGNKASIRSVAADVWRQNIVVGDGLNGCGRQVAGSKRKVVGLKEVSTGPIVEAENVLNVDLKNASKAKLNAESKQEVKTGNGWIHMMRIPDAYRRWFTIQRKISHHL